MQYVKNGLFGKSQDPTRCSAKPKNIPPSLQAKVTEKLKQIVRHGLLEPLQLGGITSASPVLRQRKKIGELRLFVDLKEHIDGKIVDEDYKKLDVETIFHKLYVASYFGKIDLSDIYYQIEPDEGAKDV